MRAARHVGEVPGARDAREIFDLRAIGARSLAVLLGFVALQAIGGGIYGLAGARGIPTEWLRGSPFDDYFVPSFVLLVVVGGSALIAAVAVLRHAAGAFGRAVVAGFVLEGWIAAQVVVIGHRSFLQPVLAMVGVAILALAQLLPHAPHAPHARHARHARHASPDLRTLASYFAGIALRPVATFRVLLLDERRLRLGTRALLVNAALYTLVYLFLVLGHGRPTVFAPWLAIDPESYYRWNVFFLAPSMVASWLLAAAVAQLAARALGGVGRFEDTLSVLGFGTLVASLFTSVHDVVTSFLGAMHVIDQRAYEDALSRPGPLHTMLWMLMTGYLVAFVFLYARGLAAAHRLRGRVAAVVGFGAFVAYQLVFCLFNR